jgi:8-oxo-dGTP pyrophosphatase MutT (NUDIX family)
MREAREVGGKPEVLLRKRHASGALATRAYVFPGGRLASADVIPAAQALSPWCPVVAAAERLPDVTPPARALGFWIAALRATFEAVGMLLARHPDGRLWSPSAGDMIRMAAYWRSLHRHETLFVTMMHDLELYLATDLLLYFAHWITPATHPRRFSGRFFMAPMPDDLVAVPEAIDQVWIDPDTALQRYASGDMDMMPVTMSILQTLSRFSSVAVAVEHLRNAPVEMVLPKP